MREFLNIGIHLGGGEVARVNYILLCNLNIICRIVNVFKIIIFCLQSFVHVV